MPLTFKTKGIILKINDTPSKDKLVYILCSDGLIKAFMTPKRSAGKKSYTVDIFSYGEIVLYQTDSGNYLVNSITPEEFFYGIRNDIASLYAAGYFAALSIHISQDADSDSVQLLKLLYKSLMLLSSDQNVKKIKSAFEIKAVQLLGFTPCLEADKKSVEYYFDLDDGRLYHQHKQNCIYVPRSVVAVMYNIINSDALDVFDFELSEQEIDIFYNISQQYIIYHTERNFDTLNYLNGVI